MVEATPEQKFHLTLIDQAQPIGLRYQAVFELKNINTPLAIEKLIEAYPHLSSSVLLSHQVLYTLGQLPDDKAPIVKDFLIKSMQDVDENALSRHEAAEALANYFWPELPELYQAHLDSNCDELRWTCQIALKKVKHQQLRELYGKLYSNTKEPAPPFTPEQFEDFLKAKDLEELFKEKGYLGLLLREDISLFDKYRVMYLMRNQNSPDARKVLCQLLSKEYSKTQTSLLKHEVCFVLGQIGCEGHEHLIRECIENEEEQAIVRHQALAAVASQSKDSEYLNRFTEHPNGLIRESALVAQFQIKYWAS